MHAACDTLKEKTLIPYASHNLLFFGQQCKDSFVYKYNESSYTT